MKILLLLGLVLYSTEAKPNLQLTADEKFKIVNAHDKMLAAYLELNAAQTKVNQTKVAFEFVVSDTLKTHNVDPKEYQLCGGPSVGCEGAPENDVVFRKQPVPVPETKQ